jgi:hypothetical protein
MTENSTITVLQPKDVLFGRGSGPNDHKGNIKFRELVSAHKAEYMATNNRQNKAKIARSIVDTVYAMNGRFLKKAEPADMRSMGIPHGMDVYIAVSDDTVMEKAKQALRQNREMKKKDDSPLAAPSSADVSAFPPNPPKQPDLAYGEYDVQDPEPIPLLAQKPAMAAYHTPEMVVNPLDNYAEEEAQFATYTTQLIDPDEDTRGLRQPDLVYGKYDVQDPEPDPSLSQQPPLAAYHTPGTVRPLDTYSAEEAQFTTYTTQLPDPDEDNKESRRGSVTRTTMEYGPGAAGSRRGSLLGGRRDAVQSRRDSAMSAISTTGSRRESFSTAEVWRRDSMVGSKANSMEMSDLIGSFRGMSAADFNSSSDTVGTIDHMVVGNMSAMSMQSVTELFRYDSNGEGSVKSGDPSSENQTGPLRCRSGSNEMMGSSSDLNWGSLGTMNPPAQMNTRASITPGQLASLMTGPIENISASQFMSSDDLSGSSTTGGSSRSALVAGMNTKPLFDINKSVSGECIQILPP